MTIRLLHVAVQPVLISSVNGSVAPTSSLSAAQLTEFATVGVVVQPVLVIDDGDTLTPGPQTQPRTLTAEQFAEFAQTLPAEIAALNEAGEVDG